MSGVAIAGTHGNVTCGDRMPSCGAQQQRIPLLFDLRDLGTREQLYTVSSARGKQRAGKAKRIDLRPEVFRFTQGAVSSDRTAINLVYAARTQIVDPRAAFESTQNYREEISIRLQSVVKAVCSRKARLEIQTDHQTFSNNVQMAASQILRAIGCECLTFELLQVDSAGAVVELDNSDWDLRRTSAWRPKAAAPVAGGPVGH